MNFIQEQLEKKNKARGFKNEKGGKPVKNVKSPKALKNFKPRRAM